MMVFCQKVVSYSQELQAFQSRGGGELGSSVSDRLSFTEIDQISDIIERNSILT